MSQPQIGEKKMYFNVKYRNERCKKDAIKALNEIEGISARNDIENSGKLLRDVIVTVSSDADHQIPLRILQIFGSVHKKLVLYVTFNDPAHKTEALKMVKALKGVVNAEFEPVNSNATEYGPKTPLPLKITGEADPKIGEADFKIVRNILQKYGARIH